MGLACGVVVSLVLTVVMSPPNRPESSPNRSETSPMLPPCPRLGDLLDPQTLHGLSDVIRRAGSAGVRLSVVDSRDAPAAVAGETADVAGETAEGRPGFVVAVEVDGCPVGWVTATADASGLDASSSRFEPTRARESAEAFAGCLSRLANDAYASRQRVGELTALNTVTLMLAEARDVDRVLSRAVKVVAGVMGAKAASIRLIDREADELVIRAVHNLSAEYLAKGRISLSASAIDAVALGPQGYEYVRQMSSDPRVQYPGESEQEGIHSMLSVGMKYQGRAVGVLRVYTAEEAAFSPADVDLLKAIASQAAAALENVRLVEEAREAEALEKQVRMAADVQQRMLPGRAPHIAGLDMATVYVPAYDLGGDLYDFIELPDGNLGIVIADVSGKGLPASLIMASVRAALRAQVDNVYYLYEVVRRLNTMLCRDTKPSEFVTLFYGVLDTRNNRLTYCDAGHPPGLLKRGETFIELNTDNMILGVDPDARFTQSMIDLRPGDALLLYTDGLTDAMNFRDERFGHARVLDAFARATGDADAQARHLLWELRRFVGLTHRTDDVTLVLARVNEPGTG